MATASARSGKRPSRLRTSSFDSIWTLRAGVGAHRRASNSSNYLLSRKHNLRHRRVTTWLSAGHSLVNVQKVMGHADLKTTMRNSSFVRSDLESLVERAEVERQKVAELTL